MKMSGFSKRFFTPLPDQPRIGRLAWGLTAALLLLFGVLETSFFTRFDGFPFFGASPSLTLMAVTAFAFFAGGRAGGIAGLASGVFLDCLSGAVLPVSGLVYFLCGYLVGELNLSLPVKDFRAYAVAAASVLPVRALLTLARSAVYAGEVPSIGAVLVGAVLPELFWTAVAAAALFPLFRRIVRGG